MTSEDINVRILLLSVEEFAEYQNMTGRSFSQDVLDVIAEIEVPATRKPSNTHTHYQPI